MFPDIQSTQRSLCPEYISSLFKKSTSIECRTFLCSSNRAQLLVPPPAKAAKFRDRFLEQGNPILWNALPDFITKTETTASF